MQDIFDLHGGSVLSVLVGLLMVIAFIAVLDGRKGDGHKDPTHRDE